MTLIYLRVGATYHWRALKEAYNFASNLIKIYFKKKNNTRTNIVGGNKVVYYGKVGCGYVQKFISNKAS